MDAGPGVLRRHGDGEPRVAVAGIIELDRLLAEHGFRQTSRGGVTASQEARHEGITTIRNIANVDPATEQFDAPQMQGSAMRKGAPLSPGWHPF
ncbi:hypothetical protein ACQZ6Z_25310 [Agrobacterium vitis]